MRNTRAKLQFLKNWKLPSHLTEFSNPAFLFFQKHLSDTSRQKNETKQCKFFQHFLVDKVRHQMWFQQKVSKIILTLHDLRVLTYTRIGSEKKREIQVKRFSDNAFGAYHQAINGKFTQNPQDTFNTMEASKGFFSTASELSKMP